MPDAAPPPPPPPPAADEEKYKHINMGIWLRVEGVLQHPGAANKLDRAQTNGEVELHFSNQMRKSIQWTANFVGTYGGGSIDGSDGHVGILDLIAQLEPDPGFNFWIGRMLVPSDRSNFSGPYFMAPWNYPGAFGAGPQEGPFGRNDGATVWGGFGGGLLKYYVGAFNLYGKAGQQPLFTGRLNLSLLNPEPGYYNSSTYYGKDILAIGVGGQYQKFFSTSATLPPSNYSLFNADILFEKDLSGSGVVDLEGAFYNYTGDGENKKFSYYALASYLTPDMPGIGKFQPLVRVQQSKPKADGVKTGTSVDAQVGYVVDGYSTRFALGFEHSEGFGMLKGENQLFAGIQLMK